MSVRTRATLCAAVAGLCASAVRPALAEGNLRKVNHIIVIVQGNHSYDNYFGALAYAPGSLYHNGACSSTDHACVDGLTCTSSAGNLTCSKHGSNASPTPGHGPALHPVAAAHLEFHCEVCCRVKEFAFVAGAYAPATAWASDRGYPPT
jgi:hypothetical protein